MGSLKTCFEMGFSFAETRFVRFQAAFIGIDRQPENPAG